MLGHSPHACGVRKQELDYTERISADKSRQAIAIRPIPSHCTGLDGRVGGLLGRQPGLRHNQSLSSRNHTHKPLPKSHHHQQPRNLNFSMNRPPPAPPSESRFPLQGSSTVCCAKQFREIISGSSRQFRGAVEREAWCWDASIW